MSRFPRWMILIPAFQAVAPITLAQPAATSQPPPPVTTPATPDQPVQRPAPQPAPTSTGLPSETREPATIAVTGSGSVSAAPDRATVSLGVLSQRPTAAEAQADVGMAISRSMEALRALGFAEAQISTQSINLYPVYDQRPTRDGLEQEPRIVGYRASNTLRIQVDDLTLIGRVIDACIKAGCNQLEGVNFELRDDTAQRRDALAAACRDAKAKADVIASSLGVRAVRLVEAVESGVETIPPIPMYRARGMEMMAADAGTSVTPGRVKVDARVTVRYAIEP